MSTIIRKARPDELRVIQDLNYQLFLHDQEYDPLLNMKWPYEKAGTDYFKSRLGDKSSICLVAEVDGAVVGYLAGGMIAPYSYRTIKKQAELENTLVQEVFRGRGIGEKLYDAFIAWAREQGAERIKVSAAADNADAIRFYKRVGFNDYGVELEYEIK